MNVDISTSIQEKGEAGTRKNFRIEKAATSSGERGPLLWKDIESRFLTEHPDHNGDCRLSHNTNVV